jgi:hypothetical protein
MKFLCVLCDQPMKLVEVAPPDRGALSVVLRVSGVRAPHRDAHQPARDSNGAVARRADRSRRREDGVQMPVLGDMQPGAAAEPASRGVAVPIAKRVVGDSAGATRSCAGIRSAMARAGIVRFAREHGFRRKWDEQVLDRAKSFFEMLKTRDGPRRTSSFSLARTSYSWNLTYRCNLAWSICYLDAGSRPKSRPGYCRTAVSSPPTGAIR